MIFLRVESSGVYRLSILYYIFAKLVTYNIYIYVCILMPTSIAEKNHGMIFNDFRFLFRRSKLL